MPNKQWGKYTNSGNDRVITYPIAFSELYYANVISPDNCETFVYGISNTNINYRLCNGYSDDRWNGTQTSRLFAVGR
ncbi:gp53-like domain-containing protein [Phascolarctobacterium faecium]|uniref:gp53-like domain-containing protein n=1 Tax=Phascolarctobacterium faecium TaxID=33025 RepID=UPI003F659BCE